MESDHSSAIFMTPVFPFQDTNVTCLTTQKSKTLIKTTEKHKCDGRQTWICNATAPKQIYYI